MTLKEYIAVLQEIEAQHGSDLVVKGWFGGKIHTASAPRVAFMEILTSRKRRAGFWHDCQDPALKGEKIVSL